MYNTGRSSARKARSGVGSEKSAWAQPATLTIDAAMGAWRGSGMPIQLPGPIQ